jgi:hypothetical protein
LNNTFRNDSRPAQDGLEQMGVDELTGTQRIIRVVEDCFEPHGIGSAVDLVVNQCEPSGGEPGLIAPIEDLYRGIRSANRDCRQRVRRQRKDHRNRFDLSNHDNARIGGRDHIADIDHSNACNPVDRRRYACVVELDLSVLHASLVSLNGRPQRGDLGLLPVHESLTETSVRRAKSLFALASCASSLARMAWA